jgi:splicing factor 3A subunit 2
MVDRQHRPGGRTGSGGPASYEDANVERREQLKRLALEMIDISKDPYFLRNHVGTYECRLCLTYHTN